MVKLAIDTIDKNTAGY